MVYHIGHALQLSTWLRDDMDLAVVFDIIIARWLLAVVCLAEFFFSTFLCFLRRAQCLMADSAGDKAHLDAVTAHTLHALY